MSYQLHPSISFCVVEARPVFLDRAADRYFMLSGETERSFVKLIKGDELNEGDRKTLQGLIAQGLLRSGGVGFRIIPCELPSSPVCDLEPGAAQNSSFAILGIVVRMAMARRRLKRGGLDSMLRELGCAKRRMEPSLQPLAGAHAISSAFKKAGLISRTRDRCLSRSFAIAARMVEAGVPSTLVIGVQLGPFQAHCWVQHGQYVIGDRAAHVRDFTPILIL